MARIVVPFRGAGAKIRLSPLGERERGELADRPIALVPLGTGNDLARALDLPLDAADAARLVLTGRPQPMDLLVDDAGGVVVNAVHVGVGAEAADTHVHSQLTLLFGASSADLIVEAMRSARQEEGFVATVVSIVTLIIGEDGRRADRRGDRGDGAAPRVRHPARRAHGRDLHRRPLRDR